MDGILFDTERIYQETWRELAKDRGVELEKTFTKTITGTSGDHMREVVEEFYHTDDGNAVIEEWLTRIRKKLAEHVPVKTGVPEILQYFKKNDVRIAVASSSFREQIEGNLRKSGLCHYFDEIVSGAELKNGKPAPDIFLHAANMLGLKPEECYVFEDSANGVRAGHAAGCKTIMIPDLIEPTEEIAELCDGVFMDFHQVKEAVEEAKAYEEKNHSL